MNIEQLHRITEQLAAAAPILAEASRRNTENLQRAGVLISAHMEKQTTQLLAFGSKLEAHLAAQPLTCRLDISDFPTPRTANLPDDYQPSRNRTQIIIIVSGDN